jgi:hypothetical protein
MVNRKQNYGKVVSGEWLRMLNRKQEGSVVSGEWLRMMHMLVIKQ